MKEKEKIQIRKRNMKLFSTYRTLSMDYIFFYTISFLFLTQIKNINPADVILEDSFYYLFAMFAQIPATFIIEFLGRKNSITIANIINCIYIVLIILSKNLFDLIIAEILSAIAFAIKESAEPSLLNESIPPTKNKGKIFAKINGRGTSNYYIINAISMVLAGILYEINPYIPMFLSLTILLVATILSCLFIEPIEKKNIEKQKIQEMSLLKELKEGFKFVLKSERVKGLILFSALITSLISITNNYEVSMLEELNISASYIGIIFAVLGIITGIATKKQEQFHNRFKNKTLTTIGIFLVGSFTFAGISGIITKYIQPGILFIIAFYIITHASLGLHITLMDRYLSNFTNEKIDTKIFTANNFLKSIASAIVGVFASFLLNRMETAYCMIAIGIIFFVLILAVSKFMKSRVGLKPEEYSKEEVKYDKIKV